MILISAVIPTYGRLSMAIDCIESIVNNNYSGHEILVVDQEPRRRLEREIITRYGNTSKIRYFFLEPPGVSRACNLGVRQAKGEVVAFIDDDAIADPNWLGAITQTFTEIDPRPALMGGRTLPIWPFPKPRWYPAEREFLLGIYDRGDEARPFPGRDLPMSCNMAGLRQVIIDNGGFDENLGADHSRPHMMLAGEESMLCQRIKHAGHLIYYQPAALIHHRILEYKLNLRFFLRRNFWEGVTVATRRALMATINPNLSTALLTHYLTRAVRTIGQQGFPSKVTRTTRPISATAMLALSYIAYGLGILHGAIKLKSRGLRWA